MLCGSLTRANAIAVVIEHIAGLARGLDAALPVRPIAALACERADARLLEFHGIERIDAGGLGVKLHAGKLVERFQRVPGVRVPATISRAGQASDPSQLTLQQARDLAGRRPDGWLRDCDVGWGGRDLEWSARGIGRFFAATGLGGRRFMLRR